MCSISNLYGRAYDCHIDYQISEDGLSVICTQEAVPTADKYAVDNQKGAYKNGLISTLTAISGWSWWQCTLKAGTHIVIKGYNRI